MDYITLLWSKGIAVDQPVPEFQALDFQSAAGFTEQCLPLGCPLSP